MTRSTNYVFLHGGGQGGWVWNETIEALRSQTDGRYGRSLALDAPGCGAKRYRDTSYLKIDDVVSELITDIAAAGMKDVVLVGHSQAGSILPRMVERKPNLFRRLVYVSCIAPAPGKNLLQQMGSGPHGSHPDEVGWPFDPKTIEPGKRNALMFCNDMSDAATATFVAKLGKDSWPADTMAALDWRYDHLSAVASTYVLCLNDAILPAAWQETFATRLQVQRRVCIDAGHQVMNTRPQALAEVLRHEA
jgi:pimeloyl-ACP methyl ester carboxylesterase